MRYAGYSFSEEEYIFLIPAKQQSVSISNKEGRSCADRPF